MLALLVVFLRSALTFIARRLVLLILVALVSNFWESFRNLIADLIESVRVNMVFYLYKIKDKISILVNDVADNVYSMSVKYEESRDFVYQISSNNELLAILERENIAIPDLPEFDIDTNGLRQIPETVDDVKEEITNRLNTILEGFTVEAVEEILRMKILEAPQTVMVEAVEQVNLDDLFVVNDDLPRIEWMTLNHKDQPTVANPEKWQLNDIYRILVRYFSRNERLALAVQIGKKDYFKKVGKDDRKKEK